MSEKRLDLENAMKSVMQTAESARLYVVADVR